ncbi:MAG: hypothetical protein MPK05_00445, partial [Gammaproteobacteria bacterium]|nr:hypothetical protein [Gammaproteobacteria bacterium]
SGIPGAKFLAGLALWFAQTSLSVALAEFPKPKPIGVVPTFGAQESQRTLFDGTVGAGGAANFFENLPTVLAGDSGVVFGFAILSIGMLLLLNGTEKIRKGKVGKAFFSRRPRMPKNTRAKKFRKMP